MGFFSDLKEDLSQAVNELMPDEKKKEESVADEVVNETEVSEVQTENSVEEMMGSEELANLLADITGTEPLSEEEDVTNEEQMMLPESFEAVEDAMIESENAESIADSEESNSVTETMEAWTDVADTQEMSTEEAFTEETDMDVEATEYVTEPEIYMGGVTEEKNHVEEEGKSMDGQYFAENEAASDEKSLRE